MDKRHTEGQICETILVEYLLRLDLYVFQPVSAHGPVDVIAISAEGEMYLFDAKKDAERYVPKRRTNHRIHRVLSPLQKTLGVRMAYVDVTTRAVHIVPPLPKPKK